MRPFRSTGRKSANQNRAGIANNRAAIDEAEHVVGGHLNRWVSGTETPCTEVLQAFGRKRRDLGDSEDLVIAPASLELLGTVPASHG